MNLILLNGGILIFIVILWCIAYHNLKRGHVDFMQQLQEFENDFNREEQTEDTE